MNALMNVGQQLTMSSLELVEFININREGREPELTHANFLAKVVKVLGETSHSFECDLPDSYGRARKGYRFPKREACLMAMSYSYELQAKVFDRMTELENALKQARPAELSRMEILQIAMEAEQGRLLAIEQRDEAIRTKAEIGSRREATAMATASAKAREVARLKSELGRNQAHATVKAVEKMTRRAFGKQGWRPLRDYCIEHGLESRNVVDEQYGTVKAWPAMAWRAVYGIDLETLFPVGEE